MYSVTEPKGAFENAFWGCLLLIMLCLAVLTAPVWGPFYLVFRNKKS